MRRRSFIAGAGATVARPLTAAAQEVPVIGFLGSASPGQWTSRRQAFLDGLAEAGFVEGKGVAIDYRWADGHNERLPALAADLAQRRVAAIVVLGNTPSAVAAKDATATIPIVFRVASNPVELGLVASLGRPGGNLTGVTTMGVEVGSKQLELLHELAPGSRSLALLVNPTNPALATIMSRDLLAAATRLGLDLHILEASADRDLEEAFARLAEWRPGGLVIGADSFFNSRNQQLAALSTQAAIPAIAPYREFAEAGGLMSYGGSIAEASRQAGLYMGRVLRGEKPADLPVAQSAKLELIVNAKTARTFGIAISPSLLARADEVIE